MKKKTLGIATAVCILAGASIIYANNISFEKTNDTYRVIEGVNQNMMVPGFSQQEKQKIANLDGQKYDDLIKNPKAIHNFLKATEAKQFNPSTLKMENLTQKDVTIEIPSGKFHYNKIMVDGKNIIYPAEGMNSLPLAASEDFDLYAFVGKRGDLFTLNPANNNVQKVTKDQVNQYNKQDLMEKMNDSTGMLRWSRSPVVSDDKKYIAYSSNRRTFTTNNAIPDIWIVNLETGEEKLVTEQSRPITWVNNSLIYKNLADRTIHKIDITTGQSERILPTTKIIANQKDYLIYNKFNDSQIYLYNTLTEETKIIQAGDSKSRIAFTFKVSPNQKKVLGAIFLDRMKHESKKLYVYDLVTGSVKFFDLPQPVGASALTGWINNNQFAVTLYSEDGKETETVLYNSQTGGVKGE